MLCPPCFTLAAKKPMATRSTLSGPNAAQLFYADGEKALLFADMKIDGLPQSSEIRPIAEGARFLLALLLTKPMPTPFVLTRLGRRYTDVIANARPSFSPHRVHIGGETPQMVNAWQLWQWRERAGAVSMSELFLLARHRPAIATGPTDTWYVTAREWLDAWVGNDPARRLLVPIQSAWPVEPNTDTWEILRQAYSSFSPESVGASA